MGDVSDDYFDAGLRAEMDAEPVDDGRCPHCGAKPNPEDDGWCWKCLSGDTSDPLGDGSIEVSGDRSDD